ncbi:hypothetical protein [Fredinandcohnia quinoae]|nr:hypothetical protein [Fredinandcohnia sp. SECRCQ15]
MRKSEWNDDQLEQLLTQMPQIKDSQNPHEIYQNISYKIKKTKKKRWIVPSLATAAVALLLLLLVPPLMNDQTRDIASENDTADQSAELEEAKTMIQKDENIEISKKMDSGEDKDNKSEAKIAKYSEEQQEYVVRHIEEDETLLTYGVTLEEVSFPTIVSIIVKSDGNNIIEQFEKHIPQFNELIRTHITWGIDEFPTRYFSDFTEVTSPAGTKIIRIDIPSELETGSFTSAESFSFNIALNSFNLLGADYEQVEFFQSDKQGIARGQTGIIEDSIEVQKGNKKAYLYYKKEGSDYKVLAQTFNSFETIQDAIERMKGQQEGEWQQEGDYYHATIPDSASIKEINPEGSSLEIVFDENANLGNNDTCILMLDAIMMTAKEFGYETVTFNGGIEQIGDVTFGKPEPVPLAPNPIKFK